MADEGTFAEKLANEVLKAPEGQESAVTKKLVAERDGDGDDGAGGEGEGDDAGDQGGSGNDAGNQGGSGDDGAGGEGDDKGGIGELSHDTVISDFLKENGLNSKEDLTALLGSSSQMAELRAKMDLYDEKAAKVGDIFASPEIAKMNQFVKETGLSSKIYGMISDFDVKASLDNDPIDILLLAATIDNPGQRVDKTQLRKELEHSYGINQGDDFDGFPRTSQLMLDAGAAAKKVEALQEKAIDPEPFSFKTEEELESIKAKREEISLVWPEVAKESVNRIDKVPLFGSDDSKFEFQFSKEAVAVHANAVAKDFVGRGITPTNETAGQMLAEVERRLVRANIQTICENYHAEQSFEKANSGGSKKTIDRKEDNSGGKKQTAAERIAYEALNS